MRDELNEIKNETPKNRYIKQKPLKKYVKKVKLLDNLSKIPMWFALFPHILEAVSCFLLIFLSQLLVMTNQALFNFRYLLHDLRIAYVVVWAGLMLIAIITVLLYKKKDESIKLKHYRKTLIVSTVLLILFLLSDYVKYDVLLTPFIDSIRNN